MRFDPAVARILDSLGAGLLIAGADHRIRYRNGLAEAWLPDGDSLDVTFAGARFLGPFDGWDVELPRVTDQLRTLRFECVLPSPRNQAPVLTLIRCSPLFGDRSGHADGAVILVEEGSHQAATEERLEVSQRLAALGKLASRVAHELNNPLDGILRYVNLAMRLVGESPESKLKDYLAESRTGLMRMVQIIGDLLEFSRATEGQFEQSSINEIIEQAVRAHTAAANAGRVVMAVDFQTQDMPSVRGTRLYQVCSNLIKNAIEAIPDGGRLTITVGVVQDNVVIRVADTGVGLPDPPEKVFEPFFTTKAPGKGTGIGLAICKDFVEDMNGTIEVSPGEEGGALFTVRVPTVSCQHPSPLNALTPGEP